MSVHKATISTAVFSFDFWKLESNVRLRLGSDKVLRSRSVGLLLFLLLTQLFGGLLAPLVVGLLAT